MSRPDDRTRPTPDAALEAHLAALEAVLARGDAPEAAALAELETLAAAAPRAARRWGRRLARVRTAGALRARDVPAGALEGLYTRIRAETWMGSGREAADDGPDPAARWRRAALRDAFLEAPRTLALWRRTALAASVLLALGAGYVLSRPDGLGGRPALPLSGSASDAIPIDRDPRDDLLQVYDVREAERRARAPSSDDDPADAPAPVVVRRVLLERN